MDLARLEEKQTRLLQQLRQAQRSLILSQKGLSEEPKSLKNPAKMNESCLKYVWSMKSCDFKGTRRILMGLEGKVRLNSS